MSKIVVKRLGKAAMAVKSCCCVCIVVAIVSCAGFLPASHSKKDLIDNFEKRTTQILAVRDYFNSIVSNNKSVDIEFSSDTIIARLEVFGLDSVTRRMQFPVFTKWGLSIQSPQVDSILHALHWSQETLITLKKKLDEANCISVRNGTPCRVGFQRSGMGMYFYDLFLTPLSDRLKDTYNNRCSYIFYKPTVVLEYMGGAIGSQCFPKD